MIIRINILTVIALILAALLIAHKAFGAAPREAKGTPSMVCIGYYDKQGELVVEVCPAPEGPETEPERIFKGE